MTSLFDFAAYLESLVTVVLVFPAVIALVLLRAFLLWRLDEQAEDFRDHCQAVDVYEWHDRKAA